jgi:hypothetical protein
LKNNLKTAAIKQNSVGDDAGAIGPDGTSPPLLPMRK